MNAADAAASLIGTAATRVTAIRCRRGRPTAASGVLGDELDELVAGRRRRPAAARGRDAHRTDRDHVRVGEHVVGQVEQVLHAAEAAPQLGVELRGAVQLAVASAGRRGSRRRRGARAPAATGASRPARSSRRPTGERRFDARRRRRRERHRSSPWSTIASAVAAAWTTASVQPRLCAGFDVAAASPTATRPTHDGRAVVDVAADAVLQPVHRWPRR